MKKTMGFVLGAVMAVSSIGAVMSVSAAEMGPAAAAPAAANAAAAPAATGGAVDDAAALAIALADAGFTEADVNIIKCAIDFDDDDGVEHYDVDFFGPDGMKYEFDIRVTDGAIIDRSAEFDD